MYEQLMHMHGNVMKDLEHLDEKFTLGRGNLNYDDLSPDQIEALNEWQEGTKQALEFMKYPVIEEELEEEEE